MVNKEDLLKIKLNKFVDASLALSDAIENYLDEDVPKITIAKHAKEVKKKLSELEFILKDYHKEY